MRAVTDGADNNADRAPNRRVEIRFID